MKRNASKKSRFRFLPGWTCWSGAALVLVLTACIGSKWFAELGLTHRRHRELGDGRLRRTSVLLDLAAGCVVADWDEMILPTHFDARGSDFLGTFRDEPPVETSVYVGGPGHRFRFDPLVGRFRFDPLVGLRPFLFESDHSRSVSVSNATFDYETRHVRVPLWPLVVLFGILPARRTWAWCARRRGVRQGLCRGCGYDLRCTPHRCPECGRPAATSGAPACPVA